MITISTYCGIMVCEGQNEEYKMSKGEVYMFQYAEPFSRHYLYRGAVDNHNDMYHDGGTKYQVGFENVWITHRWATRVFTFLYNAQR